MTRPRSLRELAERKVTITTTFRRSGNDATLVECIVDDNGTKAAVSALVHDAQDLVGAFTGIIPASMARMFTKALEWARGVRS